MKKILRIILLILLCLFNCTYDFTIGQWEEGIIPYYLSGEFSESDLEDIAMAMETWESACGVKFEKVTPRSGAYGIIRVSQNKWFSTIGENNSFCYMHYNGYYNNEEYNKLEAITHELGHCLGLLHEHQRPDRDAYVTIVWDKVMPSHDYDFDIMDNPLYEEQHFEYDYDSIMHYPSISFSIDGSETIVARDGTTLCQTSGITEIDVQKAQAIYGPPLEE
ncbi:MAG: M12 family metallopeptidase [Spirochaetota bacterium]|nr:M12 family metallopeptidase [Spirochaetota bacterium]